jgi:hypothetical protein
MLGACPRNLASYYLIMQAKDHSQDIDTKGKQGSTSFEFWKICGLPKEIPGRLKQKYVSWP